MPRPCVQSEIDLFRPRLGTLRPVKRVLNDRVHLFKPPARSRRSPARTHAAALLATAIQTKFELCFHTRRT
jgi:hypothetical protein